MIVLVGVVAPSVANKCIVGQKCFTPANCYACTSDCACEGFNGSVPNGFMQSGPNCVCPIDCNACEFVGGDCCAGDPQGILHCATGKFPTADKHSCIDDPCEVTSVTGKWHAQFTIAAPTTITFKHGTTKTNEHTKTTTWNGEVTSHVESDLKIFGFGGKASVDVKAGGEIANQCSDEWQTNDEEDFAVAFAQEDVGKFVWQFQFAIDDSCESGAEPITKEYALTAGAWEEPCCIPGYCVDAPQCNVCHTEEYMIQGAEKPRCAVANSTHLRMPKLHFKNVVV